MAGPAVDYRFVVTWDKCYFSLTISLFISSIRLTWELDTNYSGHDTAVNPISMRATSLLRIASNYSKVPVFFT
ncbi:hypothetical protein FRC12_005477, partial [Ceratobasidium sp. 428]